MFSKILIANRGEIACRIIRTARLMNIATVAVYSDADAAARHVAMADEAVHIGASPVQESYLNGNRIIAAALQTGAEAVHPGYGFLSENAGFVDAVTAAGLVFIGPSAQAIRKMGLKNAAKKLMQDADVPVVPGYHGDNQDAGFLAGKAGEIGYPVLIKARAGGGGKGMRKVEHPSGFAAALQSARREAQASFGDGHVLIEKYISTPRHIEVQVFGDNFGHVVHLFERDCSLQRRHQKVIEEAPAPGMNDAVRAAMTEAAVKAARTIDYSGAGTVEFIVDGSGPLRTDGFWFMEMNTRLQVEHPVTEAITGQDLVEWQLRIAAGEILPLGQDDLRIEGHAFEARLYAEDPANGFLPVTGRLTHLNFGDARIDTGVEAGAEISPHYDPMIAKIITHDGSRTGALQKLHRALSETHVAGTVTNVGFLAALCRHHGFAAGQVDTGLIERDLEVLLSGPEAGAPVFVFAGIAALDLDLSDAMSGWRLWGDASHALALVHNGAPLSKRLMIHSRDSMSVAGHDGRLDDIRRSGSRLTARFEGRKVTADVVRTDSAGVRGVSVLMDGRTYWFVVPDPLDTGSDPAGGGEEVTAPMTGVVKLLDVAAGQSVQRGDRLLVMEAMKMELSLTAPRDGVIAQVACAVGRQVADGTVLVRFEEAESGPERTGVH